MRKRTVLWAIAALMSCTLTFMACGGDKNLPTGDSGMPTSSAPAPVASNPQPVSPPATGAPGIDVALVSSTFDPDRCTDLTQEPYKNLTELVEVAKVTNNTALGVYAKPAIFHTDDATCGAHASNPGGTLGLMEAENIPPGESRNWTHRFTIPENACGSYQFDNDAKNGEISKSTLGGGAGGKVINTGRDCPSCKAFAVQVAVTGEGLTRTVSVTFKGQKPSKKALVDFGDGTTAELANGASVSHTWPYGEFIVKATLEAEGLSCFSSTTVKNEKPCQVEWIELKPEITYGEWGECKPSEVENSDDHESKCSQSRSVRTVIKEQNSCTGEVRVKSDKTTTESRPCECKKDSCDNYQKPVITGAPETQLTDTHLTVKAGSVAPGGGSFNPTLPKSYERPDAGSPAGEWEVTYTLPYGPTQLECEVSKEFEGPIPPKEDSCDNYKKPEFGGALALTSQTSTQVTVTSGTVSPAGGSFSPSLPSVQSRPPAGSGDATFSTDYTVSYGPSTLKCTAEHEYSIKIPQQEGPSCPPSSTTMSVNWTILREATYGNNPDCGDFGLTSLYKKEFGKGVETWSTDRAASIVIVKDGKCSDGGDYFAKKASPTDPAKWIGSGLSVSFSCDGKAKDLSHVEMCGCPVNGSAANGLFDPYLVADPVFE